MQVNKKINLKLDIDKKPDYKSVTKIFSVARALMYLGEQIIKKFENGELKTKKGPVVQTAIVAGIQSVKKTSELIPMSDLSLITGVSLDVKIINSYSIEILCNVSAQGNSSGEMEALTGATTAALTVYNMCKNISKVMIIKEIKILNKI